MYPTDRGWGFLRCLDKDGQRLTLVTEDVDYMELLIAGRRAGALGDLPCPSARSPSPGRAGRTTGSSPTYLPRQTLPAPTVTGPDGRIQEARSPSGLPATTSALPRALTEGQPVLDPGVSASRTNTETVTVSPAAAAGVPLEVILLALTTGRARVRSGGLRDYSCGPAQVGTDGIGIECPSPCA